jgi:hypothetical protein
MFKPGYLRKILLAAIISLFILLSGGQFAEASYSTGFKSPVIEITAPGSSGLAYDGIIKVQGKSGLNKVWFCLRGPSGELVTYSADVSGGNFELDLPLRFGQGRYTVWAGDNSKKFDGKIRFEVENRQQQDTRYTAPSAYVDSEHPDVVSLAAKIAPPEMSDMEKLQAIHGWVTRNISYDYQLYLSGENRLVTASQTIKDKQGTCRDYAFVVAALARAAGLPARVVYGQAGNQEGWASQLHAWNEVYAGGRWVSLDTTWDAGYIKDNNFVARAATKFFNPEEKTFAKTHLASNLTLH